MAATENFQAPNWGNPIDEDLDDIRNNFNFLLCLAAAGAEVAPGWQTAVDISTSGNYAAPDSINLTRGTRAIKIDGDAPAPTFSTTARSFGGASSPQNYYEIANEAVSPRTYDALIPATDSGDSWNNMTLVFCIKPGAWSDKDIFATDVYDFVVFGGAGDGELSFQTDSFSGVASRASVSSLTSPQSGLALDTWSSVMIAYKSGDQFSPEENEHVEIWIDGNSVFSGRFNTNPNNDARRPMAWNGEAWVGKGYNGDGYDCDLSFVYCKEEYLDPATYWSSFFDENNKPKDIGTDGSGVTGTIPETYVPDADFTNNRGSGPNWTEVGTVPLASDSPSD